MSADTAGPAVAPGDVAGRFVTALCASDLVALAPLFAADAVWTRPGLEPCAGREAILVALRAGAMPLQPDGPLRVTKGSEVAWPSREDAGASTTGRPRVDIVDVDAQGHVAAWLTVRSEDEPDAAAGPAQRARCAALEQYVERTGRADAEAALALYAAHCDVEDPVGTPVHQGRAAVETFYRTGLTAITSTTPLGPAIVSGDVGAIAFRVELTLPDRAIALEVIDVMTFDADHRFTSMRAFWGRVNRLNR